MSDTLQIAEAVRHALKTANATVERLISENDALYQRIATRDRLLKLVQTDAGNWLHSELQDAIAGIVGPEGHYRALDDSGLSQEQEKTT